MFGGQLREHNGFWCVHLCGMTKPSACIFKISHMGVRAQSQELNFAQTDIHGLHRPSPQMRT